MSNYASVQLPPPKDWQAFERLCYDLWKEIWNDPEAMMHGRAGQEQFGVDVYGTDSTTQKFIGIQCKGKNANYGTAATETELRDEVAKALKFAPPLDKFYFLTTSPDDAKLQLVARQLSDGHAATGCFSVHVFGWDAICNQLNRRDRIAKTHFPQFFADKVAAIEIPNRLEQSDFAAINQRLRNVGLALSNIESGANLTRHNNTLLSDFENEIAAQIDKIKELILHRRPKSAQALLAELRTRVWEKLSSHLKWRILSNEGASLLQLNEFEAASLKFREAYELQSGQELSGCNLALALFLSDKHEEALDAAEKVLTEWPDSGVAQGLVIRMRSLDGEDYNQILEPSKFRDEDAIHLELGQHEMRMERYLEARRHFDRALKISPDRLELRIMLAQAILAELIATHHFHPACLVNKADREGISEAIKAFEHAITELGKSEVTTMVRDCTFNLCSAYFVVGKATAVEALARDILFTNPIDKEMARYLILALISRGAYEEALSELRKWPADSFVDQSFLTSDVLVAKKEFNQAETLLRAKQDAATDANEQIVAGLLLSEAYVANSKLKDAQHLVAKMVEQSPKDARVLIKAAELCDESVDIKRGFLKRAEALVNESNDLKYLTVIASVYLQAGFPEDASRILSALVTEEPDYDSEALRMLLASLVRLNKDREALALISRLPSEVAHEPYYLRLLAKIHYQAGDLQSAIPYFEKYLMDAKDDLRIRLAWANALLRLGSVAPVVEYFKGFKVANTTNCADRVEVIRLLYQIGLIDQAVILAFDTRRLYFHEEAAHVMFIGVGFRQPASSLFAEQPVAISAGCAFEFSVRDATSEIVLMLDPGESPILENERLPEHALCRAATGKRVGEEFVVRKSSFGDLVGKVSWIKSKYLHALHDSLNRFPTLFPESDKVVPFILPKGASASDSLSPILKQVSRHSEHQRLVRDMYQKSHLPIGFIARLNGRTNIEAWLGLMDGSGKMLCCGGSHEERSEAISTINNAANGVLVDAICIYAIHHFELSNIFTSLFGRLGVTQATVDQFRRIVAEREAMSGPRMTLSERNGEFVRTEYLAEDIAAEVKRYKAILEWIATNCEIVPALGASDIDWAKIDESLDAIGPEATDILRAISGSRRALITDDWGLRDLVKSEVGGNGAFLIPVLMVATERKLMSMSRYSTILSGLIDSTYDFVSVDANVLLELWRQDGCEVTSRLQRAGATMAGGRVESKSYLQVASNFLIRAWSPDINGDSSIKVYSELLPPTARQRIAVTTAILNCIGLATRGDFSRVYLAIVRLVYHQTGQESFIRTMEAWRQGHFLLLDGA